MRKAFLSNASAMLGVPVDSWASPVKYLFSPDKPREGLAQHIEEINEENAEHMAYKKEFSSVDLNVTYQQLPQDRIDDQCNKNILMMKSMEHVLDGRLHAFNKFLDSLSKTRNSFDVFQSSEGTLRQALDALFVFIEQELQQARQQLFLGDLKKDLIDTKNYALRMASEYEKEVTAAAADVTSAEKALSKSKETMRKLLSQKKRIEMGQSSDSSSSSYFRSSLLTPPPSPSPLTSTSADSVPNDQAHSISFPSTQELEKNEKYQENKELLERTEHEVRQHIRELLRLIGVRDQVCTAYRRALQKLNRKCKSALSGILRKIVDREREALAARSVVVDKLDKAVENLSCEEDEKEFIENYMVYDDGELVQCSRALSILGDIVTIDMISKKDNEIEAGEEVSSTAGSRLPRRVSGGTVPSLCSMEEATMHMSKIFLLSEWPSNIIRQDAAVENVLTVFGENDSDNQNLGSDLISSIQTLLKLCENLEGRKVLVSVLNQFRSKQVDVGIGFKLLAAVLWNLLTICKSSNDVHNGKIVMMLSQTFYMLSFDEEHQSSNQKTESIQHINPGDAILNSDHSPDCSETNRQEALVVCSDAISEREDGGARRKYLKELLVSHPIWLDAHFWEQALWQCVLEQLVMVRFDEKWHDMEPAQRIEAVRHVHDVIFSQVMAIAHSMIELGCSKETTREFVYRMCVVHQLSERQLHELLRHLNSHNGCV